MRPVVSLICRVVDLFGCGLLPQVMDLDVYDFCQEQWCRRWRRESPLRGAFRASGPCAGIDAGPAVAMASVCIMLASFGTDSVILMARLDFGFAADYAHAMPLTHGLRYRRMTDLVLLRVAQGDARAVRECIDQFGSLIWSIARRLTRSRADAEDAVQEIFTDIWRSASRFDPEQGSEKVFVATIARRRLIDRLRRAGRHATSELTDEMESSLAWADPGTHAETCAEAQTAARAVMQLRPEQRQVLELGLLQGLSHSEIAEALQMPLGTVKTMMRRGLLQVRQLMGVSGNMSLDEVQP